LRRLDSGINITDSQSGFRAFAGDTREAFRFKQTGLAIESEMLVDAVNTGLLLFASALVLCVGITVLMLSSELEILSSTNYQMF